MKASQVVLLGQTGAPVRAACEILAQAGMLDDDRIPSIDTWFTRAVRQLPEPMAGELRTWFETMRDGSTTPPRCKPRNPDTIRLKLRWALPALHAWAVSGHASLSEITREEVIVALPPSGTPRATAGAGLRSVFTILKAKKVVFTNPTAGIRTGSPETREPLPAAVSQLRHATRTSAVQADWITKRLGISAQAIREDRILDEAQATRGDVRRLIDLFGLSVEGAQRYTATISHPAIGQFADSEDSGP